MMGSGTISLKGENLSMRFYDHWLFKEVNLEVKSGESLLITGPNGSGKSTLLRILAGHLSPTRGSIQLLVNQKPAEIHHFYRYLSWSGPYFELYTDLSLEETIRLHFNFRKNLLSSPAELISKLQFEGQASKLLRNFSSGMLHRLKIGLALFTDAPLLLLDEPTSNMDAKNAAVMLDLIDIYAKDRLLIFASNEPGEFERFSNRLDLG